MNPAQGKIIGKSANAQISLQPGQDLPVYRVLKLVRSSSYGALKPLLEDDDLEAVSYTHLRAHET